MITQPHLVDAKELLALLFSEKSRPSLRWLRDQQAKRSIPFVRLGNLVFFDLEQVRTALQSQRTMQVRKTAQ